MGAAGAEGRQSDRRSPNPRAQRLLLGSRRSRTGAFSIWPRRLTYRIPGCRWIVVLPVPWCFLTVRGYPSLEGDEAYRLQSAPSAGSPSMPMIRLCGASMASAAPRVSCCWRSVVTRLAFPARWPSSSGRRFLRNLLSSWARSNVWSRRCWRSCGGLPSSRMAGNIGTHDFQPILLDRRSRSRWDG